MVRTGPDRRTEASPLTPGKGVTFQCGIGMLRGNVKVVNDLKGPYLNVVREEASDLHRQRMPWLTNMERL